MKRIPWFGLVALALALVIGACEAPGHQTPEQLAMPGTGIFRDLAGRCVELRQTGSTFCKFGCPILVVVVPCPVEGR